MTDPRSPQEWELLFDRYLAGELSRAEETELLRGLAERGEDRWAVDALRACRDRATAATVRTIGELSVTDDRAADLEGVVRLERALRLSEAPIDPPATRPRALSFRHPGGTGRARDTWPQGVGGTATWRWAMLATVLVVALGVGLATHFASQGSRAASVGREYATTAGQRSTFTLVDGTQITLGPASRVRVPLDYGQTGTREVMLDGEGYFAVEHDAARPFAVHAQNAIARDVGTRFAVRSYPNESAVQVVVAEGAVSLGDSTSHGERGTRLSGGMLGRVDRTGLTSVTPHVFTDDYVAWTRGELRFVKAPLHEVLAELGRWYDLDVRTDNSALGARLVTASFPTTSADTVFTTLAAVFGARWQRAGRVVVLTAVARSSGTVSPD